MVQGELEAVAMGILRFPGLRRLQLHLPSVGQKVPRIERRVLADGILPPIEENVPGTAFCPAAMAAHIIVPRR